MGGPQAHANSVENPPLRLQAVCGGNRAYRCDCDLVAKLAKRSRQHLSAFLLGPGIRFAALLDKSHPLMQDLPDHTAEPMDYCSLANAYKQRLVESPAITCYNQAILPAYSHFSKSCAP
jgi:hypothetical protein